MIYSLKYELLSSEVFFYIIWINTVCCKIKEETVYKRGGEEKENEKICFQADKQTKNNQTNGSNTEATLILCGYSGSWANNCTVLHSSVLYCIKRWGWKRKKFENLLTHKEQTIKRFKDWDHSNPLWILEGAGQLLSIHF